MRMTKRGNQSSLENVLMGSEGRERGGGGAEGVERGGSRSRENAKEEKARKDYRRENGLKLAAGE